MSGASPRSHDRLCVPNRRRARDSMAAGRLRSPTLTARQPFPRTRTSPPSRVGSRPSRRTSTRPGVYEERAAVIDRLEVERFGRPVSLAKAWTQAPSERQRWRVGMNTCLEGGNTKASDAPMGPTGEVLPNGSSSNVRPPSVGPTSAAYPIDHGERQTLVARAPAARDREGATRCSRLTPLPAERVGDQPGIADALGPRGSTCQQTNGTAPQRSPLTQWRGRRTNTARLLDCHCRRLVSNRVPRRDEPQPVCA